MSSKTFTALPPDFIRNITESMGPEGEELIKALDEAPPVSIRMNPAKPVPIPKNAEKVEWCDNAYYLPSRPDFIFDPLFHAGAYYVQEASSTIYETLAKIIVEETGNKKLNVIDLCAAPGGKSTAVLSALPENSFFWANEYVAKRVPSLKENLTKWGYGNCLVTNLSVAEIAAKAPLFDIVIADAPCSGEGMMRKDDFARSQWSPELVNSMANLQKEILTDAVKIVKPGGFLIYSTCTFNTIENEGNVLFISEKLGMEPYKPSFKKEWGIPEGIGTDLPVYRFMPHKTKGEGLFLAVFRKPGEYRNSEIFKKDEIESTLYSQTSGKDKYIVKNKKESRNGSKTKKTVKNKCEKSVSESEMTIEEVLSKDFILSSENSTSLNLQQALAYLKGESIVLHPEAPTGVICVSYEGLPLGPVKNIGQRANNLYPKGWRIKKDIKV